MPERTDEPSEHTAPRTEPEPDQAPGEPEGAASEAARGGGPQTVPLSALPASDLLTSFLSLMAMKAWEGMGLVANPLSGKTEKNLEDARLAIDAYAAVLELLRPRVAEGERREIENALTMLRVNFVDKSGG
jgi:Domain of unknown function (DUF1844)